MRKKKLIISAILFCMVICLSAPRLWAGGSCSATTSTDALTHEEILSEFNPNMRFLLGDNFFFGDFPSQMGFKGAGTPEPPQEIDSGKKGPDAAGKLPDTSTESEPIIGYIKLPFLEEFPVSQTENRAVEKAREKANKAQSEIRKKGRELKEAEKRAKEAAEKLGKALNDTMDAEPGEEARKAAKKAGEAAKEAEETAKDAENAKKEYKKAEEEGRKANREYDDAFHKAYEEAGKQNEAAQEAAEKASKATEHGKANKK